MLARFPRPSAFRCYAGVLTLSVGLFGVSAGIVPVLAADTEQALPQNLYFDVTINGDPMGYHYVEYSRDGDDLVVDIDIDLRVKFAFITVFKYIHENQERWQGDTLVSLRSETLDSGENFFVAAAREDGTLNVEGSRGNYAVEGPIASTTYWNYRSMTGNDRMLNSQKGDVLDYTLTHQGTETIMARGEAIAADKYFLDSVIDTTIWYDAATKEWVKLAFDARGRTVEYTLVAEKASTTNSASLPPEDEPDAAGDAGESDRLTGQAGSAR